MKRVSMALVAVCLVSSHLMAQSAGVRTLFHFGRNLGVRQNLDGSVCFPPPSYDSCIYDLSSLLPGFVSSYDFRFPLEREGRERSPTTS